MDSTSTHAQIRVNSATAIRYAYLKQQYLHAKKPAQAGVPRTKQKHKPPRDGNPPATGVVTLLMSEGAWYPRIGNITHPPYQLPAFARSGFTLLYCTILTAHAERFPHKLVHHTLAHALAARWAQSSGERKRWCRPLLSEDITQTICRQMLVHETVHLQEWLPACMITCALRCGTGAPCRPGATWVRHECNVSAGKCVRCARTALRCPVHAATARLHAKPACLNRHQMPAHACACLLDCIRACASACPRGHLRMLVCVRILTCVHLSQQSQRFVTSTS